MQHDMRVDVIGCGDAYDSQRTNASLWVEEQDFTLLIDCGPTVPQALLSRNIAANDIDVIYLTHAHPDHCLGLTTLLNWMNAMGRSTKLKIVGQVDQFEWFQKLARFGCWPDTKQRFDIIWQPSNSCTQLGPWKVRTSPTIHSVSNLSLCLKGLAATLFYSGDGMLTREGQRLAACSDIVFAECEYIHTHHSHGSWETIAPLARKADSQWFLYHVDPQCRSRLSDIINDIKGVELSEDRLTTTSSGRGIYAA